MQILLVLLMYGLWSSSFPLGKYAVQFAPPVFLTSFRMLLAGAILLLLILFKRKSDFKLGIKQYLSLFVLGFFSIYLTNICEFWGLQYLSAAKTCFIYSLSPFFAVFFSYIHFKEKLTLKKSLGLLIGFVGFIPVLMLQSGSENLLSISTFLSWPDLAIAGAALFSVYGWVLLRVLVKDKQVSPLMANGTSMVFGGVLALVHSLFVDVWSPVPIAKGSFMPLFGGVMAMTFISNIICFNLYGYMLKRFTATFLSFAGLLSPVFASLNSWILLGEKPSYIIFLSTGIVCLGLWIVYRSELKQGYIKKRESEKEVA